MLSVGTQLGPYEIVAPLGAGGMGEVYRSRDPRLNREVAIKVLPATFSDNLDRLRRFEQEARAAAALNHPNILAIYDVGSHDRSPYVVSELLEGETLRERLRGGALSQRRAVEYGLQITRGLAVAHEKGIVHRDLKPENLFVTNDGHVKILDFGLAKLTRPEEPGAPTDAPTLEAATDPGLVLGTVGYMSPEQVRGKPADHRSDIFSFGAILYEMIAGKRAFGGDTAADTMSAILKEDPPDLSESNRNVPPALERIVRHCLEKNPAERFQSARDVAFNLEALTGVSGTTRAAVAVRPAIARRWLMVAGIALALMVSYGVVFLAGRGAGARTQPVFHRLTFRHGSVRAARFAPDGNSVVYGASWDGNPVELFTARTDSAESRPMGLPGTQLLAISSAGEMAVSLRTRKPGAFGQSGTLGRMPLVGGAPREVMENVAWADWTPDGSALAAIVDRSGESVLEFPPGKAIYRSAGWLSHVRISPRGDLMGFLDHVPNGDDGRAIIVDREGNRKAASSFYSTTQGLAWSPKGDELWFTAEKAGANRALYAMTLTGKERLVLRVPTTLTLHDIARDGRVLLTNDSAHFGITALPPGESKERDLSLFDWSLVTDFSPDGKLLVFSETGEGSGGKYATYLRKTDGSPAVRLGDGSFAWFSPDVKSVLATTQAPPSQLVLMPTGAGETRQLTQDKVDHIRAGWFPDGKRIVFVGAEPGHRPRAYVQELDSGKTGAITPEGVAGAWISPDGNFLLAWSGGNNFFLYPSQGGEPKPVAGLQEGDVFVRWNPDGNSLMVVATGEIPTKVFRVDLTSGKRELWKQIVPSDPVGMEIIAIVKFAADGKSYAYSYYRLLSDLYIVEGLK